MDAGDFSSSNQTIFSMAKNIPFWGCCASVESFGWINQHAGDIQQIITIPWGGVFWNQEGEFRNPPPSEFTWSLLNINEYRTYCSTSLKEKPSNQLKTKGFTNYSCGLDGKLCFAKFPAPAGGYPAYQIRSSSFPLEGPWRYKRIKHIGAKWYLTLPGGRKLSYGDTLMMPQYC